MREGNLNVVLVHGAWADGSSWSKVIIALRSKGINTVTAPLPVGCPLWKDIPSWYLIAEQDHLIVPETQRFMAERMQAQVRVHPVDHTPSVSAPGPVVDLVLAAAREVRASHARRGNNF
jgi:hypothetical protein